MGAVIQEDIAIVTRAEDVRKFYGALGTPPSQQAQLFLEVMLEGLERLPRAGETECLQAERNIWHT